MYLYCTLLFEGYTEFSSSYHTIIKVLLIERHLVILFSIDFGFARQIGDGTDVTTACGSYAYAAPELISSTPGTVYDGKKADIWSM